MSILVFCLTIVGCLYLCFKHTSIMTDFISVMAVVFFIFIQLYIFIEGLTPKPEVDKKIEYHRKVSEIYEKQYIKYPIDIDLNNVELTTVKLSKAFKTKDSLLKLSVYHEKLADSLEIYEKKY